MDVFASKKKKLECMQYFLKNWTSQMKEEEKSVNGGSEFDDESLPPIRSGVISLNGKPSQVSVPPIRSGAISLNGKSSQVSVPPIRSGAISLNGKSSQVSVPPI